jgi:predicted Zn-dependent peptidase
LSSADDAAAVKSSLIHVIRRGIADRVSERDWRYIYTRVLATDELLDHEKLSFRTEQLLLGAHFAKDPDFSLKRLKAVESSEPSAIMELYDRAITDQAARAVLAVPGSNEELAAVPLTPQSFDSRGADVGDIAPLLAGIEPVHSLSKTLSNGLRVIVAQRPNARFQTALLGFFDGTARVPPAVVDAVRFSLRTYIVDPPAGVLQTMIWDEDAARRIVRGPAGDTRVLLRRLAEGLDHYDFNWKSEGYLDFAKGQKQRENDPREKTPRDFRARLFNGHPYGAAVVSADVDAVTVPQLRTWYDAVHRPENGLLVLVGPEAPAVLFQLAEDELGSYQRMAQRETPVPARNPLVAGEQRSLRLFVGDKPTESQVSIEVGCILPPSSAGTIAAEEVLQDLVDTALDYELRQRTGATYGANSWLERLRGGTSVLHAQTSVSNEQLGPSLRTLYTWFVDGNNLVTEQDAALARFSALQSYVLGTETSVDLASALFSYARRGLGPSDLEAMPKRIASVDTESVARLLAACQKSSLFSAVGDERRIRAAWPGGH